MLSRLELAHTPHDLSIYVGLFVEVQNADFLRQQLLGGNADFEFAFIDARLILSTPHLLAAIFRAINDMTNKRMKSRNVHSEIVFALNPNNNIAEAYRRFGITDDTTSLVVVKIASSDSREFQKIVDTSIQGQLLELNDANLAAHMDEARIRKTYKLQPNMKPGSKAPGLRKRSADAQEDLEISILGLMALRGAT